MTERAPEPHRGQFEVEPRAPEAEEAFRNNLLGLALFALSLLLFAGTVAVGLVYLAFD